MLIDFRWVLRQLRWSLSAKISTVLKESTPQKELLICQKTDEKREEKLYKKQFLEVASYYRPNPSISSNETFSAKSTVHSSRGWMTETTRLHVMKEVESCQTNTESSRDEKEDAKAQERKRAAISTVINILESKHDRSLTSSKTECLQDSSFYSSITSSKQHYFQKFKQQKKPI
ncbi:hypothetical protein CICLE_v10008272mg, partial [Citrus x clementina]